MTEKHEHEHGASDDACDWEILKLANEKGKFAIELGLVGCDHIEAAFSRGIDNNWWTLVDVCYMPQAPSRNPLRVFKLTTFGESRRAQLEKKFAKPATH